MTVKPYRLLAILLLISVGAGFYAFMSAKADYYRDAFQAYEKEANGNVELIIHEVEVEHGVVLFAFDPDVNGISLRADYIKEAPWLGWQWGHGNRLHLLRSGTEGPDILEPGIEVNPRLPQGIIVNSIPNDATLDGGPFPLVYGVISRDDIAYLTITDLFTGWEYEPEQVVIEPMLRMFYSFIVEDAEAERAESAYEITAYDGQGEKIFSRKPHGY